MVGLLERIHVPRFLAVFLTVALAVAGLGIAGWTVANQLIDVTNQLPSYKSNIKAKIDSIRSPKTGRLDSAANAVKELGKEITDTSTETAENAQSRRKKQSSDSAPKAGPRPGVPAAHQPTGFAEHRGYAPGERHHRPGVDDFHARGTRRFTQSFDRPGGPRAFERDDPGVQRCRRARVSRYLLMQMLVNTGYGVVMGLGLYFIGVPNALLWGTVAAIFRFLPYIGAPLAAILPILLVSGDFRHLDAAAGNFVAVLDGRISGGEFPRAILYGANTGISSFAILFAAIFWALIWGPIGLLLSTPLTVCLVVIGRHVPTLSFLNVLLGDQPVLPPEAHYYQRLLASDQAEAKQVLEEYLKDHSLEELYDAWWSPRWRSLNRTATTTISTPSPNNSFVQSTKELLEELADKDERD